MKYIL